MITPLGKEFKKFMLSHWGEVMRPYLLRETSDELWWETTAFNPEDAVRSFVTMKDHYDIKPSRRVTVKRDMSLNSSYAVEYEATKTDQTTYAIKYIGKV